MRVIVDIERSATTVTGQITAGDVTPVDFFGWLELIDRLARAADTPQRRPPALPDPGARGTLSQPVSGGDTDVV
jgi:hypothetical protein